MYMRAMIFRIVYVGIFGIGILLSLALRHSTVQAAPATPAPVAGAGTAARQASTPARLPTVTLATIRVHAVRARSRASAVHEIVAAAASSVGAPVATMPTLRLDMPYYSFGKMLPRVSKE